MTDAVVAFDCPADLEIFPELAARAVKTKKEALIVAWALFRAADAAGQGQIPRSTALAILRAARCIGDRQARRQIQHGAGRYWTIGKQDRLWLVSPAKLAEHFDVSFLSRPHRIPIADLCGGRARRRAALQATVYRTDPRGRLISRRQVRELTGVAQSTQRRYENQYGHVRVVDPVHVQVTHITREATKSAILHEFDASGFYRGRGGDLMRRHADRRQAVRHLPGSRRKARRANTHLAKSARSDRPATTARGERSGRAFFPTSPTGRSGHRAWLRSRRALGKPGDKSQITEAVFDYGVIEVIGRHGRSRFESAVIPDDPNGGHRSGRSQKAGKGSSQSLPDPDSDPNPPPPSASHSRPNNVRSQRARPKEPT